MIVYNVAQKFFRTIAKYQNTGVTKHFVILLAPVPSRMAAWLHMHCTRRRRCIRVRQKNLKLWRKQ